MVGYDKAHMNVDPQITDKIDRQKERERWREKKPKKREKQRAKYEKLLSLVRFYDNKDKRNNEMF